jgi:hypothetical protein
VGATLWSAYLRGFTDRSRRRALIAAAVAVTLLAATGVLIVVLNRPAPPRFYSEDAFLRLGNFSGYTLYKPPTVPGPYRSIGAHCGGKGESVSGSVGSVPYTVAGVPGAWVMAVGIVNPTGQCGTIVLVRYDKDEDAGAATQAADR